MKVGGASGPLYGTLFMTLGKELPAAPSPADVVRALRSGDRGRQGARQVGVGQKTMLDVLAPVQAELAPRRRRSSAAIAATRRMRPPRRPCR